MHETVRLLSRQLIGLNYQADTGDSTALSHQGTAGPWNKGQGTGNHGPLEGGAKVAGTTVWVVPSRVAPKDGPLEGGTKGWSPRGCQLPTTGSYS